MACTMPLYPRIGDSPLLRRSLCLALPLSAILLGHAAAQAVPTSTPTLQIQDLGKGDVPLDGAWQFHLGDDPSFAAPAIDDATGHNGWEQITTDAPWGAQGHRGYVGYAWYRRRLSVTPVPGVEPNWSILIPRTEDVYSIYWDGQLILTHGKFPPYPSWVWREAPQALHLGPLGDGVLAIRVFKNPLGSYENGLQGGFHSPPVLGGATAINREVSAYDYRWLKGMQFAFAVNSLEALVAFLALISWWRDRTQRLLLLTGLFCISPPLQLVVLNLQLPLSYSLVQTLAQPLQSVQDLSLMYLLLVLFDLQGNPALARWTKIFAVANAAFTLADSATILLDWSNPHLTLFGQWSDAICTVLYTSTEIWPVVLVVFAIRGRLDAPRGLVAAFAFFTQLAFVIPVTLEQGSRFTHWTIGNTLLGTLFTIGGNEFDAITLFNFGLLISIIYAVFTYSRQVLIRKQTIENELRSAQELLQVLIPEALPSLPGYALTSSYQPAQEVGGDFFQIVPAGAGSHVIALGDVSGKGLRAAMAVSLIVGTIRTLVEIDPSPPAILAGLNRRLHNRLQGGFATALALCLDAEGRCTVANAGHLAPFLNGKEIPLTGSLPLGISEGARYEPFEIQLQIDDFLVMYTDGLLEARNSSGELFGFERIASLVSSRPSADQALQAARAFGQEDDITVLTLTRLALGEKPTTEMTAPVLAPTLA